jgi:hypothetical protein
MHVLKTCPVYHNHTMNRNSRSADKAVTQKDQMPFKQIATLYQMLSNILMLKAQVSNQLYFLLASLENISTASPATTSGQYLQYFKKYITL